MGVMCYLCRRKASKSDRISLHKFPKNPILRNMWIEACDLSHSDNLTYIFICSLHFNDGDIVRGNQLQTRTTLRSSAVPSIGVPRKISCSGNDNKNTPNDNAPNKDTVHENTPIIKTENISINDDAPNQDTVHKNTPTIKTENISSDDELEITNANGNIDEFNNIALNGNSQSCYTTPKRRFFEPRYISEITTADFDTPRRTERILSLVRETDKKKSKIIKALREKNRKLEKRICSLEEMVLHLKKKKHDYDSW